tara:strand:+ start:276 stop:2147 length:1872 start_codon:yes stop_codon:yes gene_type:complete
MAIRVKLIRRDNSVFPPELHPIYLDVTDLSVTTERNISVFSIPVSDAKKIGLDLNIPSTVINIRGVLADEAEGASISQGTPDTCRISTFPLYPTFARNASSGISRQMGAMDHRFYATTTSKLFTQDSGASISKTSIIQAHIRKTKANSQLWTGMSTYSKTGRSTHNLFASANNQLSGDSVYNSNIKLVSSGFVRTGSNTMNHSTSLPTGEGSLILSSPATRGLEIGEKIYRLSVEDYLDGMGFALVPFHWAHNGKPSAVRKGTPIVFIFDGTANSAYSTLGSSVNASLVSGTKLTQQSGNVIPTIKIPIKGIFSNPTSDSPVNSSPCAGLAKAIEAAINSNLEVSDFDVISTGGKTVAHAFTASVTGTGSNIKGVDVQRDEVGDVFDKEGGIKTSHYDNLTPLELYGEAGTGGVTSKPSDYGVGRIYSADTTSNSPINATKFSGGISQGKSNVVLSAGDKAQNLLGLFANSPINSPTEIAGIQIPYQSLITSNTVSPEVRNFFLTYGSIPEDQKTSVGNTRPASEVMEILKFKNAEVEEDTASDNVIDQLFDSMGTVGDILQGLHTVVGNILGDIAIAINEGSMGNKGGIRIIASKLDINYQAGDTEYTFNMLLSAVHQSISP